MEIVDLLQLALLLSLVLATGVLLLFVPQNPSPAQRARRSAQRADSIVGQELDGRIKKAGPHGASFTRKSHTKPQWRNGFCCSHHRILR